MNYTHFNGLIILAIGCNVAYMVSKKDALFFSILEKVRTWLDKRIEPLKTEIQRIPFVVNCLGKIGETKLDEVKALFGGDTKKIIDIKENWDAGKVTNVINSQLEKMNIQIKRVENTKNLQYISFITFLYAFYIALRSPYETDQFMFNNYLFVPNLTIIFCALLFAVFDYFNVNKWQLSLAIIFICLLLFYFLPFFITINPAMEYNYVLSVLTCFVGFLVYMLSAFIGSLVSLYILLKSSFTKCINDLEKFLKIVDSKPDFKDIIDEKMKENLNRIELPQ